MLLWRRFETGPLGTNVLFVACSKTQKGWIVDPSEGACHWIETVKHQEGWEPEAIVLTHSHWDHIIDASKCQKKFSIPLFVHEKDGGNVKKPGSDGLPLFMNVSPAEPTDWLFDGQELTLGETSCLVIHTPGHSPGGVCLFWEKEKVLISGDTLFKGSIGSLSLPTSDVEAMKKSIRRLLILPDTTCVIPGHGEETVLGGEKKNLEYYLEVL